MCMYDNIALYRKHSTPDWLKQAVSGSVLDCRIPVTREFKRPGRDAEDNFDLIIKMILYFTYQSRDTLKSFSFIS